MRPISFPVTIVLLMVPMLPTYGAGGDWRMWRHDPALTGYQPTPGGVTKEFRIPAPERTDSSLRSHQPNPSSSGPNSSVIWSLCVKA
jgi:hypothetical protein